MKACYIFSLVLIMAVYSLAENGNLPGSGDEDSPFLIEDFNDFTRFCNDPTYWEINVYTRLDTDIDLSPDLPGRMIYGQSPIAPSLTYDTGVYYGIFDGNGHTISNLHINGEVYCGLFGYTKQGSYISNLGVVDVNIKGIAKVGAVVGRSTGDIVNCYSTGTVISEESSGGGLAGVNFGTISNCYSTCNVTGKANIAGLVGVNYTRIYDSYATGTVVADYAAAGFVGFNFVGKIYRCYSTGYVNTTTSSSVGGFVGQSVSANGGTAILSDCFWDVTTSGQPEDNRPGVTGLITRQMMIQANFISSNWDFNSETQNGSNDLWHMPNGTTGYPMLFHQRDIAGDITGGYGVDFDDFALASQGWAESFVLADLVEMAENWLSGK